MSEGAGGAYGKGGRNKRPVDALDEDGEVVQRFPSLTAAAEYAGVSIYTVFVCCRCRSRQYCPACAHMRRNKMSFRYAV